MQALQHGYHIDASRLAQNAKIDAAKGQRCTQLFTRLIPPIGGLVWPRPLVESNWEGNRCNPLSQ